MSNEIKKGYEVIIRILNENKEKKVKSILDEIIILCEKKKVSKSFILDTAGQPFARFCYYHKVWEIVNMLVTDATMYGIKTTNKVGINEMCKIGNRKWTQRNKAKKDIDNKVLQMVISKEIETDTIDDVKNELLEKIDFIDLEGITGFTEDEVLVRLKEYNDTL